jgi:hypothetical protein
MSQNEDFGDTGPDALPVANQEVQEEEEDSVAADKNPLKTSKVGK